MDVKLDPVTGDIDDTTTPNDVTLLEGSDAVEQHWRIRMRHFRGEWFLDRRTGVPYYEEILKKNPNPATLRFIFRRVTESTPGISFVTALELELDAVQRKLSVEVEGKLEPGVVSGDPTFRFEYSELILPQAAAAEVT